MKGIHLKHARVLAFALSTRGFGFALFEGSGEFVDWGVKSVEGDKNRECVRKAREMITHYEPEVIVLQDSSAKGSRRSPRIRTLTQDFVDLAAGLDVSVVMFSRDEVWRVFFDNGKGTKHALAEMMAKHFPEELGHRLPPKRKPWVSEDCRMDIFDAVALAVTFRRQRKMTLCIRRS